jgi:adenylate cyclase
MAKEIERKFLVRDASILEGRSGRRLVQGYISTSPNTTRVRIAGDDAFLTIKGPPTGISCDEFEVSIPLEMAQGMMALCGDLIIEKTRYEIPVGERTFEVDVFHGKHAGLVLAEVELPHEQALVAIPEWVGEEVSGQRGYSNAYLALQGCRSALST